MQVTRLNGHGPALLVLPEPDTPLEAYRPLYDDPTPRGVTFEGFYEWMAHSQAYAENEWKNAAGHWNPPTSRTLAPGASVTYGVRFALSPTIRAIEPTLIAEKRPVARRRPRLRAADRPAGPTVCPCAVGHPVRDRRTRRRARLHARPEADRARLAGLHGPRARRRAAAAWSSPTPAACGSPSQYFVIPPEADQVQRLGAFHADKQWFSDPHDPFHAHRLVPAL